MKKWIKENPIRFGWIIAWVAFAVVMNVIG